MERFYADIIDSIEEGIVVFNNSLEIKIFNQRAERLSGISKKRALNPEGNIIFEMNAHIREQVEKSFRTGQTFSDYDSVIIKPDGSTYPVSLISSPLISGEGNREGTVLLLRDIKRLKGLEEDLRRSDNLASIGILAAGLAHEIKNPLGGIRGSAQLLQMEVEEESKELADYTSLIIRETDRISGLIEELLDFANPKNLELKQLNIHEILDSVIALQSRSESTRGTEVRTKYDPSIPALVGDRDKLSQVLLNIIKNGCEAMDGKGTLNIVTRVVNDFTLNDGPGPRSAMIAIDIKDEGPGIAEEEQREIFTPFYTKKRGGTGLGLAVSLRIMEAHRGTIRIKSQIAKGSTFSIYLPLR